MRRLHAALLAVTLLLTLGMAACTDDSAATSTAPPQGTAVPTQPPGTLYSAIREGALEHLEVRVGSTVAWENLDASRHTINTITSTGQAVDSGEIGPGETYEHRFGQAGVWELVVDNGTQIWTITVR